MNALNSEVVTSHFPLMCLHSGTYRRLWVTRASCGTWLENGSTRPSSFVIRIASMAPRSSGPPWDTHINPWLHVSLPHPALLFSCMKIVKWAWSLEMQVICVWTERNISINNLCLHQSTFSAIGIVSSEWIVEYPGRVRVRWCCGSAQETTTSVHHRWP